ncbi:DUF5343 domain-containing protein [Mesorhizobium sp. M0217]|uniref:DUF5343 domain-containing protein n=1 Tax=unclassified Mesorhizobium TaxID=325217 RepID=UPI0033364FEE
MVDIVYTTVPGKIKTLLTKIRGAGVPSKVTQKWLKGIGFNSSNDGTLIPVLRVAGLIDGHAVPTPKWSEYRTSKHRSVLGGGIKSGYSELFAVYPDANKRSNAELENVFASSSSVGKQAISKTVSTFKTLVEEADFEDAAEPQDHPGHDTPAKRQPASAAPAQLQRPNPASPSLHIDIQVHISSDASLEQIDKVFSSMAKHLYGTAS